MDGPYLLFLGDARDDLAAKSAKGVLVWRPERCLAQMSLPGCKTTLGLTEMTPGEAAAKGAKTMLIGVANAGGFIPDTWTGSIVASLEAGLDVGAGLHARLGDIPAVKAVAQRLGRTLYDLRHPTREFAVGKGSKRPGMRLLTVGTDCSCGKMFTSLALEKEMRKRGWKADFRATGQTGIMIAGDGVSVDAVVADFISGATEWLAPANDPDHWDLIEGQGSLFHPSYAGVTLGLIHGSQPDAMVVCHEPTRAHMRGLPDRKLPSIKDCIAATEAAAHLTNPKAKVVGLGLDTSRLSAADADTLLQRTADEHGLPACDSVRTGVAAIVDRLA
ncbi:MAG: DUF1611 domain-containing protein [Alphaproteobacteria bacterium]|nr:DUF1611 domain-containing protein [Alphaproteobacteria bacterium]